MKINLVTRKTENGNLRLSFSYHCQSRRLFATGVTISPTDFRSGNFEKPIAKTNPKADHYNNQISLLYHEIQQIISTLRREDKVPLADLVYQIHQNKKKIELKPKKETSFTEIFEKFLDEKSFTASTRKLYQNLHDQLLECYPHVDIEEFELKHWTQFRIFLKTKKKHAVNTICIRLNKLKAMIKYLKTTGYEIPIRNFPLPKEEIKKIFLDLKDLQKVLDFIPSNSALSEIKDLFIFQCYTALRISDLRRLCVTHLKEVDGMHFISMGAYKTNKPIMIPINQLAWYILLKYKFKLPLVTEQHYNREIKRLIKFSGISTKFEWQTYDDQGRKFYKSKFLYEIFTNHCCSRTAIKYFFSKGYTPDQVARIVGKSLDTIMGYYYEEASEADIIMRTRQFENSNI
jgi:integrase